MHRQRLLVSVRGKLDAIAASSGGAHIIDAEYPGSALGTCYPANIHTIRRFTPLNRLVSTNIGEMQFVWSTAGQAAVGVALAGADIIKVGLGKLSEPFAKKVMKNVTKQVRFFFKAPPRQMITTLFADDSLREYVDPVEVGARISVFAKADGVLIDTFDKQCGKGLLDWLTVKDIRRFAQVCHKAGQEAWIAGSITESHISFLWRTGVDVICVRGAACEPGSDRLGPVSTKRVKSLVNTIP